MFIKFDNFLNKVLRALIAPAMFKKHYNWLLVNIVTLIIATLVFIAWEIFLKISVKLWFTHNLYYLYFNLYTLGLTTPFIRWGFFISVFLMGLNIYYVFKFKKEDDFVLKERQIRAKALEDLTEENREYRQNLLKKSKLLEIKEQYATAIFTYADIPLVLVDKALVIARVNPAMEKLTKRHRNSLVGLSFDTLCSTMQERERLLRNHSVRLDNPYDVLPDINVTVLDLEGRPHDVNLKIKSLPGNEEFIVSIYDQTLSKQLQKELAMQSQIANEAIQYSGGYLWTKDAEGKYVFCDPTFCADFFGFNSVDGRCSQVIGKTDIDLASLFTRSTGKEHAFGDACVTTDDITRKKGKVCRFIEMGVVGDELFILDVTKRPKFDTIGDYVGVVGFAVNRSHEGENVIEEVKRCLKQGTMEKILVDDGLALYEVDYNSKYKKINKNELSKIKLPE